MDSNTGTMKRNAAADAGVYRLSGGWQRALIVLWCAITLASVVSLVLSIYSLNVWDSLPAADTAGFFSMTPVDVQAHADWQALVRQAGLSLPVYAWVFTLARLIAGAALLAVSVRLMRRYSSHLIGALMALLLPALAAAGIWINPLFGWGVAIAPWMKVATQILGWLTWCGAIVIYLFPNGAFAPKWTAGLAILVVPLMFLRAFEVDVFLNPDQWPWQLSLLLDALVIGGTLAAVLDRRAHADARGREALRGYALGWSLLVAAYFVLLLIGVVYDEAAGHALFEGTAAVWYVAVSETAWFACATIFATGLAASVFRGGLLEGAGPERSG